MYLQKAFGTVDHQILLAKLNQHGNCGVSNDWFKSYLSNHSHYVSINGYYSGLPAINCGVPQRSVLGPLLFLLYINDLYQTTKFCKVHHFADNTNLLCLGNSGFPTGLANTGGSLKFVSAIFYQIFIFSPNDTPSKTVKNVLFHLKSSFCSQDIQIFVIFPLPLHTFQVQKNKWKWNNLRSHELACINLQV